MTDADMNREIGELRAEFRAFVVSFQDHRAEERRWFELTLAGVAKQQDDHSHRLRALERWRSILIGAGAAVAALWGVFKTLLITKGP